MGGKSSQPAAEAPPDGPQTLVSASSTRSGGVSASSGSRVVEVSARDVVAVGQEAEPVSSLQVGTSETTDLGQSVRQRPSNRTRPPMRSRAPPPQDTGRRPGVLKQLSAGYGELVNAIIRPPRAEYSISDLGPVHFSIAGRRFKRTELRVRNTRGLTLECSWWEPIEQERVSKELPCVVYMHGNSSCRLEAVDLLPLVLQTGCSLFAFDFAGCGLSEGEYVSLGYHEKDDAREVIDYLRSSGKVSTIALWGRSMGAATALLHGHRDPSIAAMVLDSPFSSLERLAREIIDQAQLKHKPDFLVRGFMRMMRNTILKRTSDQPPPRAGGSCTPWPAVCCKWRTTRNGLDILKLRPIENVDTCFIPALFVAGKGDQFIPPAHARDICEAYAGDKNFVLVDGNHNSRRPAYFMDSVAIFFYNRLCIPAGLTEDVLNLRPQVPRDLTPGSRLSRRREPSGTVVSSVGTDTVQSGHEGADDQAQQELQEALLASLASPDTGGGAAGANGISAMATRLVTCATSATQSTLPERRPRRPVAARS